MYNPICLPGVFATIRTPGDCPSRRATYTSFFWLRKWPNPLEWEPLCKNLAVLMTKASLEIEREIIYDHGMFAPYVSSSFVFFLSHSYLTRLSKQLWPERPVISTNKTNKTLFIAYI